MKTSELFCYHLFQVVTFSSVDSIFCNFCLQLRNWQLTVRDGVAVAQYYHLCVCFLRRQKLKLFHEHCRVAISPKYGTRRSRRAGWWSHCRSMILRYRCVCWCHSSVKASSSSKLQTTSWKTSAIWSSLASSTIRCRYQVAARTFHSLFKWHNK